MKTTKIQWHPGFVAAMNLEFSKDRQGHMPVCISLTGKEWMQYPISHIPYLVRFSIGEDGEGENDQIDRMC